MTRRPKVPEEAAPPIEAQENQEEARRCASLNAYGSYLFGQGRWEEARSMFVKASKIMPQEETTARNLAVASSACGLYDEATEIFAELTRRYPEDAALHNGYGLVLHRAGHLEQAAAEFARATELAPTDYMYWHHKGTNALTQGKVAAAVTALARAVALPGAPPVCYFNLAMALGAADETERGTMFLQKAVALRVDDPALLVRAARIMDAWGRRATAIECLQSFVRAGYHNREVDDLLSRLLAEPADGK